MTSEALSSRDWLSDWLLLSSNNELKNCRNAKGVMERNRQLSVVRIKFSIRWTDCKLKIKPSLSLCSDWSKDELLDTGIMIWEIGKLLMFLIFAASERLAVTRIRIIHGLFSCRKGKISIRSSTIHPVIHILWSSLAVTMFQILHIIKFSIRSPTISSRSSDLIFLFTAYKYADIVTDSPYK